MNEPKNTAGKVIDILSGAARPEFDFNVAVENDTIVKIVAGAVLAGIVIIILNRVAARLF
jgi:hypothetical protein